MILSARHVHTIGTLTVGGTKSMTFQSHPIPTYGHSVQVKNADLKNEGRRSRRQMVRPTMRTVASSNYTLEKSKKAERSTTSVDLLVLEAI